jgi:hypothetical protein
VSGTGFGSRSAFNLNKGGTKIVQVAGEQIVVLLPAVTTPPSLSDMTPDLNTLLTATPAVFANADPSYTTRTRSWYVNDVLAVGEVGLTFQCEEADVGKPIKFREVATNAAGTVVAEVSTANVTGLFDAAASAYFAAMTVQPSDTRKGQIDTLVTALKACGAWAKLDILGLHAAHNEQASRINLKNPAHLATVVGALTFTADRGQAHTVSAGVEGYLNWGAVASWASANYQQGSMCSGVYSRSTQIGQNGYMWGFLGQHYCIAAGAANYFDWRANSGAQSNAHTVSSNHKAFWGINRPSAGVAAAHFKRDKVKSMDVPSGYAASSYPVGPFTIFRAQDSTTNYGVYQAAVSWIGGGMTDAEYNGMIDALQAYLTAVGA